MKNILFLAILLFLGIEAEAQRTSLKGKITDYTNKELKGVEIYIDMKRIGSTSNARGKYSFKYPKKFQLITVYTPKYGLINWKYNGERRIDFVFPEGSTPIKKEEFLALGYSAHLANEEYEKDFYANYGSILEILDRRFPEVRVRDGRINIVRRGINAVLIESPLILVNNIPMNTATLETIPTQEVKSIRVITKGSEAAVYGHRGMNGVILVKLKTAEDRS